MEELCAIVLVSLKLIKQICLRNGNGMKELEKAASDGFALGLGTNTYYGTESIFSMHVNISHI